MSDIRTDAMDDAKRAAARFAAQTALPVVPEGERVAAPEAARIAPLAPDLTPLRLFTPVRTMRGQTSMYTTDDMPMRESMRAAHRERSTGGVVLVRYTIVAIAGDNGETFAVGTFESRDRRGADRGVLAGRAQPPARAGRHVLHRRPYSDRRVVACRRELGRPRAFRLA